MPSDNNNGFNDMVSDDDDTLSAAKIARDKVRQMYTDPSVPNTLGQSPQEQDFTNHLTTAVAGAIEPVDVPLIAKIMGKGAPEVEQGVQKLFGDSAETAATRGTADITSDMANNGLATAADQAKTQQALSRAVDMQQRTDKYKALRKMMGK